MAFGAPNQTALQPGQAQNLASALRSQSAPVNPKTPDQRVDPSEKRILDLQRIRRSLEIAIEPDHLDQSDPLFGFLSALHGAITRLRDGAEISVVVQSLSQSLAPQMQMSPTPIVPAAAGLSPGPAATAGPPPGPVSPPIPGGQ